MSGTFSERIAHLRQMTGMPDRWHCTLDVDQVYAHAQHEHLEYRHPRGGRARYLADPLMDHYRWYLDQYAKTVLRDGGKPSLIRAMEDLSAQVNLNAPREFDDLRNSGHPIIELGERTVYDRAPHVHRLTPSELRIKARIRYMALPDALKGWIWWHVQHHDKPPPRRRGRR